MTWQCAMQDFSLWIMYHVHSRLIQLFESPHFVTVSCSEPTSDEANWPAENYTV